MKNLLFFLMTLTKVFCDAQEQSWVDAWCQGIELSDSNNFAEGIAQFSIALDYLEKAGDIKHPEIYVDRGQVYRITK